MSCVIGNARETTKKKTTKGAEIPSIKGILEAEDVDSDWEGEGGGC